MSIGKVTKNIPWIPTARVIKEIPVTAQVSEPVRLDMTHPSLDAAPVFDWDDWYFPAERELRFD